MNVYSLFGTSSNSYIILILSIIYEFDGTEEAKNESALPLFKIEFKLE
jgi:hypothetical protein